VDYSGATRLWCPGESGQDVLRGTPARFVFAALFHRTSRDQLVSACHAFAQSPDETIVKKPVERVNHRPSGHLGALDQGAGCHHEFWFAPDRAMGLSECAELLSQLPADRAFVKVAPDNCHMCHPRDSRAALQFSTMLPAIHLAGDQENHFLTKANGTCTGCRNLDQKTGTWGLGNGVER
jgi:hypothetical protein